MSPEIKQIILKNFEFFLTFGTLLVWMVLIRYTWPLIALFRKFVLALFSFLFFKTWVLYVGKGISYLEAMDADGFLRRGLVFYGVWRSRYLSESSSPSGPSI